LRLTTALSATKRTLRCNPCVYEKIILDGVSVTIFLIQQLDNDGDATREEEEEEDVAQCRVK
jgi:hypothetical protein